MEEIAGYRKLDQQEIDLINAFKEQGTLLGAMIAILRDSSADQRWLSIGQTHIQQGIMALVRAVAKPEGF